MTDIKKYEILEGLPTYGPMYIPVSESGEPFFSEGFAVRFYKTDGSEWAANFQTGWTDLKGIFALNDTSNLLIIACGTCYLMNSDIQKPVSVFGVGYKSVLKTQDGRLILQDQTNLTIIEADGNHWDSETISWDGLKELKLENNIVSGFSYDPNENANEWVYFSYNIDNKVLTGGSWNSHEKVKKPWWKIW